MSSIYAKQIKFDSQKADHRFTGTSAPSCIGALFPRVTACAKSGSKRAISATDTDTRSSSSSVPPKE